MRTRTRTHTHTHTHVHTHTHTQASHTHTHTHTNTHTHASAHTYPHTSITRTHTYTRMHSHYAHTTRTHTHTPQGTTMPLREAMHKCYDIRCVYDQGGGCRFVVPFLTLQMCVCGDGVGGGTSVSMCVPFRHTIGADSP